MFRKKSLRRCQVCTKQYEELVSNDLIKSDKTQLLLLRQLDNLLEMIEVGSSGSKVFDLFSRKFRGDSDSIRRNGLYIFGGVGTGKSMLMNIFFEKIEIKKKKRIHFHLFMQEIHTAINQERKKGNRDPVKEVAKKTIKDVVVLCLDEFQITDITDAMLVGYFFSCLIAGGIYIVTTSNRRPEDLYKHGLNRALFIPFINLVLEKMDIVEMDTTIDYRRQMVAADRTYIYPLNAETKKTFNEVYERFVSGESTVLKLEVKGRKVELLQYYEGVGRSTFHELCGKALGAADYLALCDYLKILFIEEIPCLDGQGSDLAKRFVTLIDTLYESEIKVVCLASVSPERLYTTGHGSFEFSRTVSRLYEMQSRDWNG